MFHPEITSLIRPPYLSRTCGHVREVAFGERVKWIQLVVTVVAENIFGLIQLLESVPSVENGHEQRDCWYCAGISLTLGTSEMCRQNLVLTKWIYVPLPQFATCTWTIRIYPAANSRGKIFWKIFSAELNLTMEIQCNYVCKGRKWNYSLKLYI